MVIEPHAVELRVEQTTFGPTLAIENAAVGSGGGSVLQSDGGCVTVHSDNLGDDGGPSVLIWDPEEIGMSPLGETDSGFTG